jgi:hypothetical protein
MVMQTQGTLKWTKVDAIERLLSNNKRLRASYVLITKSCGKNISEKHSLLELNKVTLNYRKHDKPNHIYFINRYLNTSYIILTINIKRQSMWKNLIE